MIQNRSKMKKKKTEFHSITMQSEVLGWEIEGFVTASARDSPEWDNTCFKRPSYLSFQ